MSSLTKSLALVLSLAFISPTLSYGADQEPKYDSDFRENYKKYKSYSPAKKQRMQKLHKSVKGLSPEQKRKLRERVLNKNKPDY